MNCEENSNKLRRLILGSIFEAESGHPGGALSAIDFINVIVCERIKFNRKNDRFILSKGHAAPALYAAAYINGWINLKDLYKLRKINSLLQGHPDVKKTPWVWASTGSLGQGFSVGIGMAIAKKYKNLDDKIFIMVGDGELQEGEIWEGALCAAHHKLNNLCLVIDYNKLQSDDFNKNIINLEPLKEKWKAFNWNVLEVDGHNYQQISDGLVSFDEKKELPTVLISNTVKGKGVKFMENEPKWHGSVKIKPEELEMSLIDLETSPEEIKLFLNSEIWSSED